mmetsp:Transcript_34913/g.110280  ORF Transcript_34913/g.110280 Transcript_34913/m.110280 type:complete len:243 (+) Transcript_34913:766-1494(+)
MRVHVPDRCGGLLPLRGRGWIAHGAAGARGRPPHVLDGGDGHGVEDPGGCPPLVHDPGHRPAGRPAPAPAGIHGRGLGALHDLGRGCTGGGALRRVHSRVLAGWWPLLPLPPRLHRRAGASSGEPLHGVPGYGRGGQRGGGELGVAGRPVPSHPGGIGHALQPRAGPGRHQRGRGERPLGRGAAGCNLPRLFLQLQTRRGGRAVRSGWDHYCWPLRGRACSPSRGHAQQRGALRPAAPPVRG